MTPSVDDLFDAELLARGRLAVTLDGPRATVTLDAPESLNAQVPDTWLALSHIGARLGEVPRSSAPDGIRVVVVRGAGTSFSSGLDRRAFAGDESAMLSTLARQPTSVSDRTIATYQAGLRWLADPEFVSIAAVQGHAVGAGFQLALACDLVVASEDAQFCMAEVTVGLVPDLGGTGRLVDAVGRARALEICATGRRVGASEAVRTGIAVTAVPAAELAAAVDDLASAVTSADPEAVRAVTRLISGRGERDLDEQFAAERREQVARLQAVARSFAAPER